MLTVTPEKEGVDLKIAPETQKLNWYVVIDSRDHPLLHLVHLLHFAETAVTREE